MQADLGVRDRGGVLSAQVSSLIGKGGAHVGWAGCAAHITRARCALAMSTALFRMGHTKCAPAQANRDGPIPGIIPGIEYNTRYYTRFYTWVLYSKLNNRYNTPGIIPKIPGIFGYYTLGIIPLGIFGPSLVPAVPSSISGLLIPARCRVSRARG